MSDFPEKSNYVVEVKRGNLEGNKFLIEADDPVQAITLLMVSKLRDTTLPYLEISADLLI